VRASDDSAVFYEYPEGAGPGVVDVLKELSHFYSHQTFEGEHLLGLERAGTAVSLEPGAQLEVSVGPSMDGAEIEGYYRAFRAELDPILDRFGFKLVTSGYHPTATPEQIPLLPKQRYAFMDQHFRASGSCGADMMRASASTQVSIDYASEADMVRKFRLATLFTPFFAALSDDTLTFRGKPLESLCLQRQLIWDNVDRDRSRIFPGIFKPDFGFEAYAQKLLNSPAIYMGDHYTGRLTFAELLPRHTLDKAEVEHILSLFFFDVRIKQYLEIRAADSMPIERGVAYADQIRSIFYDDDKVSYLLKQYDGLF
jgi:glutamate--cysteine ligase